MAGRPLEPARHDNSFFYRHRLCVHPHWVCPDQVADRGRDNVNRHLCRDLSSRRHCDAGERPGKSRPGVGHKRGMGQSWGRFCGARRRGAGLLDQLACGVHHSRGRGDCERRRVCGARAGGFRTGRSAGQGGHARLSTRRAGTGVHCFRDHRDLRRDNLLFKFMAIQTMFSLSMPF